jgi:putative ABC transport system permease protein
VPLRLALAGNTRLALIVLFVPVVFLLLISCSNVANLVLARSATREREIAVCSALGAGRSRLLRQLLTESAVIAVFSGVAGLMIASVCLHALIFFASSGIPRIEEARLDAGVLTFTVVVSLLQLRVRFCARLDIVAETSDRVPQERHRPAETFTYG